MQHSIQAQMHWQASGNNGIGRPYRHAAQQSGADALAGFWKQRAGSILNDGSKSPWLLTHCILRTPTRSLGEKLVTFPSKTQLPNV
eukprot:1160558-Pelagomonas_calceolata.AAC.5